MSVLYKTQCPSCKEIGNDKSKDNLIVYTDGGQYCFACGYTVRSNKERGEVVEEAEIKGFTEDDVQHITKLRAVKKQPDYRGVKGAVAKYLGVLYETDEQGNVLRQLVPTTINDKVVGYKSRHHPKNFSKPMGEVGQKCDLVFSNLAKKFGKYIVICGGEIDAMSAFQMLGEYTKRRNTASGNEYDPIPCVSPTVGETGSKKQLQNNYTFLNNFERVVLAFDNDDAGQAAIEKVMSVLPRGKVWTIPLRYKDVNEYLKNGKEDQFVSDFFSMKQVMPVGVLGSTELSGRILEAATLEKIPLPPFMEKCNEMMKGGLPTKGIVNLGSASGIGKTTVINEIIYFWFGIPRVKCGIVSMELDSGEYGMAILSHHLKIKLDDLEPAKRLELLKSPEILQKQNEMLFREDGSDRFCLVDDRDGTVEALKGVVEELVVSCGCNVIVLDPLQDILDGMTNEEQAVFMRWQKSLVKSHNVLFFNINHIRKGGGDKTSGSQGGFISEEDFAGSSTIFKSASVNILFTRNKYAEEDIDRNTTSVYISKNRKGGRTGKAGEWYYDMNTHTMYDKEWFLNNIPE